MTTYTFLSDHTVSMFCVVNGAAVSRMAGNWKIVGNQISFYAEGQKTVLMDYKITNNGNTLELTQPDQKIYLHKQ